MFGKMKIEPRNECLRVMLVSVMKLCRKNIIGQILTVSKIYQKLWYRSNYILS